MWLDWVSNSGPLTYESGVLPTALRGPAVSGKPYTDVDLNNRFYMYISGYPKYDFWLSIIVIYGYPIFIVLIVYQKVRFT